MSNVSGAPEAKAAVSRGIAEDAAVILFFSFFFATELLKLRGNTCKGKAIVRGVLGIC